MGLITHKYEVFAFKEGHLKVCSVDYNNSAYVNLTNYSLQKYTQNFSKYEKGNEVSFGSFQVYLNVKCTENNLSQRRFIYQIQRDNRVIL